VKILLRDSRVDINRANNDGWTPLWYASCYGYVDVIKWIIALRGGELDLEKNAITEMALNTPLLKLQEKGTSQKRYHCWRDS
jgi:hypothetical protein